LTSLPEKQLNALMQNLLSGRIAILVDRDQRVYLHGDNFDKYKALAKNYLKDYHDRFPIKGGMPKEELKSKFHRASEGKLFTMAINQLVKESEVVTEEETIRLSEHKVSLAVDQEDLRNKIQRIYLESGLMPPYFKDVIKKLNVNPEPAKQVLQFLIDTNILVKVKEELYYHKENLTQLKSRLVDFLIQNREISTPQFKDMTGASRKYVIPLIEYFDASNVTIRVGDLRQLRKRN
jgi:selenocysteine-specific elongation factor